jgi:hypothetical protein
MEAMQMLLPALRALAVAGIPLTDVWQLGRLASLETLDLRRTELGSLAIGAPLSGHLVAHPTLRMRISDGGVCVCVLGGRGYRARLWRLDASDNPIVHAAPLADAFPALALLRLGARVHCATYACGR